MKYVSDKPIDFTNEDWKKQTPRERARLEAEELKKKKPAKVRKKEVTFPDSV